MASNAVINDCNNKRVTSAPITTDCARLYNALNMQRIHFLSQFFVSKRSNNYASFIGCLYSHAVEYFLLCSNFLQGLIPVYKALPRDAVFYTLFSGLLPLAQQPASAKLSVYDTQALSDKSLESLYLLLGRQ